MRQILYSPEVRSALRDIFFYTTEKWGISQADKYHKQLSDSFTILAKNPNLGQKHHHAANIYNFYPIGSHLIIYRFNQKELYIVAIIHMSMDVEKRLKKLIKNIEK
ncbi:MAG: type II toxin-antitoxin system RelE/ParE family toxin [Pseudomonadota bacterium]